MISESHCNRMKRVAPKRDGRKGVNIMGATIGVMLLVAAANLTATIINAMALNKMSRDRAMEKGKAGTGDDSTR